MRVATASEIKRGIVFTTRDLPRPGSLARRIYDKMYAERGRAVDLHGYAESWGARLGAIYRLRDDYGCDIRKTDARGVYVLCGEWFGAHYSDYVIEAIRKAEAEARAA